MGRPRKVHAGGRPTKMSEENILKLEEGLKNDFTIQEACLYAGVSESVFYDFKAKNLQFSERMNRAKQFVAFAAKRNLAQSIIKKDSVEDAKWYLSKRQKDIYADRTETTGKDGQPITIKAIEAKSLAEFFDGTETVVQRLYTENHKTTDETDS